MLFLHDLETNFVPYSCVQLPRGCLLVMCGVSLYCVDKAFDVFHFPRSGLTEFVFSSGLAGESQQLLKALFRRKKDNQALQFLYVSSSAVSSQGRNQGAAQPAPPPLKLEKIGFFGVKS